MKTQEEKFLALAREPIGRLLYRYSLPAIVAMMASALYNIVDGIFIGQGVGENAITGLALSFPLMALSAAFGAMVGVGGATLVSVKLGQRDYTTARNILGNVVLLNTALGLSFGVLTLAFLRPILQLFGASEVTLPYAAEYMRILLFGNIATHLYYGLNAQLRSTHRPHLAMYATFASVLLNVLLDGVFIFGFGWGIAGAAWATILAQIFVLMWQIWLFTRPEDMLRLNRSLLRPNARLMREIVFIGLPQLLINSCASLVSIVITRSMAEYGGDGAVGAYGIVNRLTMLVVFVVMGFCQGMQPIAGYNFGARHFERVKRVAWLTIIAATMVTTVSFGVAELYAEQCVRLFAKDAPELQEIATRGLRIVMLCFPFVGMQIVSSSFFQSMGYPSKSILLSLTRQMLFLLPFLLLFPLLFADPLKGVWYAMPASDAAATILSLVLLLREFRRLNFYIQNTQ